MMLVVGLYSHLAQRFLAPAYALNTFVTIHGDFRQREGARAVVANTLYQYFNKLPVYVKQVINRRRAIAIKPVNKVRAEI